MRFGVNSALLGKIFEASLITVKVADQSKCNCQVFLVSYSCLFILMALAFYLDISENDGLFHRVQNCILIRKCWLVWPNDGKVFCLDRITVIDIAIFLCVTGKLFLWKQSPTHVWSDPISAQQKHFGWMKSRQLTVLPIQGHHMIATGKGSNRHAASSKTLHGALCLLELWPDFLPLGHSKTLDGAKVKTLKLGYFSKVATALILPLVFSVACFTATKVVTVAQLLKTAHWFFELA